MTHQKNIRAYVRALTGLDEASQRLICEDAARALDLPIVFYAGSLKERAAWLAQLRSDEIAMVARLDVLAGRKVDGVARPLVDFTTTLAALADAAACIMDAEAGLTSRDGAAWRDLIEWAANKIASGRRLSKTDAAAMARKRWKKTPRAERGIVGRWLSRAMQDEREKWAQHWRDPRYRSAAAAFDAMPKAVRESIGSLESARRIFGRRLPNSKTAGGRPRSKR